MRNRVPRNPRRRIPGLRNLPVMGPPVRVRHIRARDGVTVSRTLLVPVGRPRTDRVTVSRVSLMPRRSPRTRRSTVPIPPTRVTTTRPRVPPPRISPETSAMRSSSPARWLALPTPTVVRLLAPSLTSCPPRITSRQRRAVSPMTQAGGRTPPRYPHRPLQRRRPTVSPTAGVSVPREVCAPSRQLIIVQLRSRSLLRRMACGTTPSWRSPTRARWTSSCVSWAGSSSTPRTTVTQLPGDCAHGTY